jgi:hypothetical protein
MRYKIVIFRDRLVCQYIVTMKPQLFASALLFVSVSLFAVTNVGVAPGGTTTTPTTPVVKPPCTKKDDDKRPTTVAPKAPEKKGDDKKSTDKKCDDDKRPFKK